MTAPVKPPTSVRGHVSSWDFATLLDELTADLPGDLLWPTSVQTYATMRREAHLSSILSGWSLQLRRAQWQLDGAGCRPEVVQLVADDLGLQVAGRDEPTAARVHGVSWNEHLRTALASLTYGHFGFELAAEIVDELARLVGLYERPPWTVGEIHTDPKSGAFLGITQDSPAGTNGVPEITADRMCWYAREREGANWAGVSLLRAAFPAWLIKREMLRVLATSSRRFGMGVSVVRALPGTNPTPAQHAAAAEMAQQTRVGDQAGGALPPGFVQELIGLTGSAPDTLGFVRFLNQEMSRSALMQHLDLGSTETGSRALGEAFIDNWMLALEAEGEHIADVATRQAAARVVGWNWGADEPVPRVVVSGIGSRREITAESLQLLLSSGALDADPSLKAWVRREYRLPEPDDDARPPAAPGVDLPGEAEADDGGTASASAPRAARRPRRREADGQLALPVAAAPAGQE